ncbi:hypothetical protein ACQZV8_11985 [Magnetococcales bacterium HHB-1]
MNGSGRTLILFIHGLIGSAEGTWGNFPRLIESDVLLQEKFDVKVWDYAQENMQDFLLTSVVGGLLFKKQIDFAGHNASFCLKKSAALHTELSYRFNHYQKVVLICHSWGGVIARQYLLDRLQMQQNIPVVGFLSYNPFFSVTHIKKGVHKLFNASDITKNQLKQLSSFLREQNKRWKKMKVNDLIATLSVVGGKDFLVRFEDVVKICGQENVVYVERSGHTDLVKPTSVNDLPFLIAREFLLERV